MSDTCQCAGTECVACTKKLSYGYEVANWGETPNIWFNCSDGDNILAEWWSVDVNYGVGREVGVRLSAAFNPQTDLLGIHSCHGGPFEASANVTGQNGYSEMWSATLTPADDGQTLSIAITVDIQYTSGYMRTCTLSDDLVAE